MTWVGALAGMVVGGATAIIWDIVDGAYLETGLYAMVPAVILSFVAIFALNGLGRVSAQMEEDFDKVVREIGEGRAPAAEPTA